jgi:hypothetical protein
MIICRNSTFQIPTKIARILDKFCSARRTVNIYYTFICESSFRGWNIDIFSNFRNDIADWFISNFSIHNFGLKEGIHSDNLSTILILFSNRYEPQTLIRLSFVSSLFDLILSFFNPFSLLSSSSPLLITFQYHSQYHLSMFVISFDFNNLLSFYLI